MEVREIFCRMGKVRVIRAKGKVRVIEEKDFSKRETIGWHIALAKSSNNGFEKRKLNEFTCSIILLVEV